MVLFEKNLLWYILPIALVGLIGSIAVDREYYKQIQESTSIRTPPSYLFGIVWTIIYIISIFAFALIPNHYWVFLVTMAINATWTYVFFKLKQTLIAMIMILLMIILAIYTIVKINDRIDTLEGDDKTNASVIMILFLIYPMWLIVAFILTIASLSVKK